MNASESHCRSRIQANRASELEIEGKGVERTHPEAGPVLPKSDYPRERGCPRLQSLFISAVKQRNKILFSKNENKKVSK